MLRAIRKLSFHLGKARCAYEYLDIKFTPYPGFRTFLSSSYGLNENVNLITLPPKGAEEMALETLTLDRCYERNMPISSLMIDRMVRNISNKQHLTGSLYYLYKFRHSENGYYLQPWTMFTFVIKCLDLDTDTLLEVLKQKIHYGVFPDQYVMNIAINHFLITDKVEDAIKLASEMFLLETLNNKVSQILALHAVYQFWKKNVAEDQLIPVFDDLAAKRNVSAIIYCIGIYSSNPSLTIIGQSLLGSIEKEHGIRAVYQDPWGPLSWKPQYLQKTIEYLEKLDQPVSQESIDILLHCSTIDADLQTKAQKAYESIKGKQLISTEKDLTLGGISKIFLETLSIHQTEDSEKFNKELCQWLDDRQVLEDIKEEILEEFKQKREEHFHACAVEEKSHEMAVETLGYWDMAKNKANTPQQPKQEVFYLQKDYVEGAMFDLDVLERFRERRCINKDSVIYIP